MIKRLLDVPKFSRPATLAFRYIYNLLASASVGGLLYAGLDAPAVICITSVAAAFALMLVFRCYRAALEAPWCCWLIPAAVTAHLEFMFPAYLMVKHHTIGRLSVGALVFSVILLMLGAVFSKVDKKYNCPNKFLPTFLVTAALCFTVNIYIPTDLFLNNRADFPFALQDMLAIPIVYSIVISFTTAINLCLVGELINKICRSLMLGLLLCIFVQNTFLNSSLPVMLGDETDWSKYTAQKIISGIVWAMILTAAVSLPFVLRRKRGQVSAAMNVIPVVLSAYELLVLMILCISVGSDAFRYQLTKLSSNYQFSVSQDKNIMIFVLDEADNAVFDELYQNSPERFQILKDFTYYDNYCTLYDSTNFSLPQIITGTDELPESNISDWYDKAFDCDQYHTFYSTLHDNDYLTCIYGDFMHNNEYERLDGVADNMKVLDSKDITVYSKTIFTVMSKFSKYKYMPFIAKPSFEPSSSEVSQCVHFSHDSVFVNSEFISKCQLSLLDQGKNMFAIQHLNGIHEPIETSTRLTEADLCLDLLNKYFSELKRLGAYDNSLIIITGDHGLHFDSAMPVFYIKEPNRVADELTFDHSPIYIKDLFSTCLINAGLYNESEHRQLFGSSIYDFNEQSSRSRLWFARDGFKTVNTIERQGDYLRTNRMYGYYFTGDLSALKQKTATEPPDIYLEFDSDYS